MVEGHFRSIEGMISIKMVPEVSSAWMVVEESNISEKAF